MTLLKLVYEQLVVKYFYEYTLVYLWLLVSRITRLLRIPMHNSLNVRDYTNLIFLPPQPFTNKLIYSEKQVFERTYSGPNLDSLLLKYLSTDKTFKVEALGFKEINLLKSSKNTAIVTWVSCNPKGLSFWIYLFRIFLFTLKLKRKNMPVIAFLPDTYFPDAALVSTLLTSLTGGLNVFLQSSSSEAILFGYPLVRSPVFWTFPESRYHSILDKENTYHKENQILLAGGSSGGLKRLPLMENLADLFLNLNIRPLYTNGSLTWEEYLCVLKKSKFLATTNYTQDGFYIGPKKFKNLISPTTTTGRTWDAFAAKCVLITNQTKVLDEIGFIPGEDYVDIETCSNTLLDSKLNDEAIRIIAEKGHKKFLNALSRFSLF